MLTRRRLLQSAAFAGAAAPLSRIAFALTEPFPPQQEIDTDPLRPCYHLMPRRGWMNDPCAPVYFDGRYHMFFQYNPGASVWGDMHWAHAVSADMVHWTERPIALAPTTGGPDSYGVFTGSMIVDEGIPKIVYTCVSPSTAELSTLSYSNPPEREQQCLATPTNVFAKDADAKLDTWQKQGVVVPSPAAGMHVTGFRDPTPWREADGWYMLLASGEYKKGGNVLLYKSADLKQWKFVKVFAQGKWTGSDEKDTVNTGEMWECPDFFPLGARHVLIHSTGTADGRKTLWQVGTLDKSTMTWTPEAEGILNHGPYYAPKSQLDAAGNRILWGWIPEDRPEAEFAKAGWAGCMSLPRVVTLESGQLRFRPAREVSALRSGAAVPNMSDLRGSALFQNQMDIAVAKGSPAHTPPGVANAVLIVARGDGALRWGGKEIPLSQPLPDRFTVHAFVDHSVVEVFLGDRAALTARVYGKDSPATLVLPAGYVIEGVQGYAMSGSS
ncbi:glycoside hydrolase family 32 protein [Terriglobus sp.]|uniref:glycoside hydrolase family 32 protein n=1 Tax=Terriglobus sp. TaxID=1889013 RepID=UPI003B00A803